MAKQKIQLSDHFNYSRLLRFVLPCIGTMLFTSIYGIVDGLCVSNFVGKTAFAAVNLIMPLPMLIGTVGFMLGTGGSAIVGITLGEGDEDKANRYFSLFVLAAFLAGVALSALGLFILRPVAILMGAKGEMLDFAVRYGRVLMVSVPTFILQNMFQSFFVTAEKPTLGFWFTVGAGCTNMVLDVVLVGWLRWGVPLQRSSARSWAACCRCSISWTIRPPAACIWAKPSSTAVCSKRPASTAPPS